MSRPVAGIACRVRVPARQYEAVALCVGTAAGVTAHVIRLVHRDPGLSLDVEAFASFATAEDYRDRLATFLDLPEMVVAGTPSREAATAPTRRRVRPVKARRPRFLTRRSHGGAVDIRRVEGREIIARG